MNTTINLEFKHPFTRALAGDKLGKRTYKKQVAAILSEEEWQEEITIRFPDSVYVIGTSFWHGFIDNMIDKIGYDGIRERVKFVTCSQELTDDLYEDLY
ncbi:hypothetical protein LNP00_06150 [Fructobacillus sp. M158]|uniref:hypothetical protein n=1 Tax=Fructobacillus parabroussonetiae TaxID=2713174 RepID=UPI00200A7DC7|nr:hypothetical protein [Fructobacillus parabroussonetiae]MCK8617933.1 hypothetical protein [Fructobacillus parabroussonetiae]